jgi:pimeloyl-ACP methyl ester carboxylesterase
VPYAFDAFWREDLPAAIQRVRAETGAAQVDVVAHSLGGMALYAYLSQGGDGVGAAVTLGSPTRLDFGGDVTRLLPAVRPFFPRRTTLPVVALAQAMMPLHGEIERDPFLLLCANPENVPATTWKRLIANGIADVETEVVLQLADLLEHGRFGSADGTLDFRADMARIRVPTLVVAGKLDRLGSSLAARDGYRALGGPKAWKLYGVETGTRADYGHMDLIMGQYAEQEIWPDLLDFLRRHGDSVYSPGPP